jgi:hypothetical protein
MHRIFGSDNQNGEKNGQKRDEVKYIHVLSITKTFALKKDGQRYKTSLLI